LLLFLSFSFFLVMCIFDFCGHLVDAEARCNWYLRDINIFSLSQKIITFILFWCLGDLY
jgi:hypothetical protein